MNSKKAQWVSVLSRLLLVFGIVVVAYDLGRFFGFLGK